RPFAIIISQQLEGGVQTAALLSRRKKGDIELRQPTTEGKQRFRKGGALLKLTNQLLNGLSQLSGAASVGDDLQGLNNGNPGSEGGSQLMVQVSAPRELLGRDDERHICLIRPWRLAGDGAIQHCFQIALALRAHELFGDLSIFEDQERGNRADGVLRRQTLLILDVDLANL